MTKPCGCCAGIKSVTPEGLANRPGLPVLAYRVGTYSSFLESMLARLSTTNDPEFSNPLQALKTREPDDPMIALLDSWAIVGDVLSFYQERIANEGYLRTAVERRSVVELAGLLGYTPRPGVASSVYLAFTLQSGFDGPIPAATAAKTMPGAGELPQTFETSEAIMARAAWNEISPRRTQPQRITQANANDIDTIYLDGTATRLKPNDRLLLVFSNLQDQQVLRAIAAVEEDVANKRTKVTLQVEEFSSVAYAVVLKGILQQRLQACPDLSKSKSFAAFQKIVSSSQPLLSLDTSADAAGLALADEEGSAGAAESDLTALAVAAGAMSAALKSLLNAPHATLQANLAATVTAYNLQQGHADAVGTALAAYSTAIATPGSSAPQVRALLDAQATVQTEAVATPEFKVLSAALKDLEDDFKTPIDAIAAAVKTAITDARTAALGAAAVVAPSAIPTLQADLATLATTLTAAGALSTDLQTKALEDATAAVTTASSGILPADSLAPAVNATQKALKKGLTTTATKLTNATTALGNHKVLLSPTGIGAAAVATVMAAMSTLTAALPSALNAQSTAWKTAIAAVKSTVTTGFSLLASRFTELVTALQDSPGDVVRDDLIHAADAVGLPSPLPAGSVQKADADAMQKLLKPLRDATDLGAAVEAATTAVGSLTIEQAAITAHAQEAHSTQDCLQKTITAIAGGQTPFRQHYADQFKAMASRYAGSAPQGDQSDLARNATGFLDAAMRPLSSPSFAVLLVEVGKALKLIVAEHAKVTAANQALDRWFKLFEGEIGKVLDEIKTAQSQTEPKTPEVKDAFKQLGEFAGQLLKPVRLGTPSVLDLKTAFTDGSDTVARSLLVLQPGLGEDLLQAWGTSKVDLPIADVFTFRVRAPLFGYNAPVPRTVNTAPAVSPRTGQDVTVIEGKIAPDENAAQVSLDASYDQIVNGSWVVIAPPESAGSTTFARALHSRPNIGISHYGMTGKTTHLELADAADPLAGVSWFNAAPDFDIVRLTQVYAQAEKLALAEEPVTDPVGSDPNAAASVQPASTEGATPIVLDGYFDGLKPGRFVVVTGERTDVPSIIASELALVASVKQNLDPTLPKDTMHTQIGFALPLQHQYLRETVKINANVAHATHGEKQKQVLGSGDGSQIFQSFQLAHLPLTYISKPTPSGAESNLEIRVNNIQWHEAGNLVGLGPNDRKYIIDIEDDGSTSVTFGDGVHGARLPTGSENVLALYRNGIGQPGNVIAKKISMLPSPPYGVTGVSNPAPATGGADPETRDQARRNTPAAVLALDRLVGVQDYADFSRTYAGIAKANASLAAGKVTVTIAGIDDIPIDPGSDLFHNLLASILQFGDPHQPVLLKVRKLKILVLQARVAIDPDYDWLEVSDKIRAAILKWFGFDRQELGAPAVLSQIFAVIQKVTGVEFVDVDHFGFIPETNNPADIIDAIAKLREPSPAVATGPDEIAYFSPALLHETIVLRQIRTERS